MWVGLKVDVTGWNSNVGGTKGRLWLVGESKGSLWLAESRMQVIFVFFRTELLDIWQGIADPQAFGPREEPPWSGRENNMCRSDERLAGESNICLSVREEPRPAEDSNICRSDEHASALIVHVNSSLRRIMWHKHTHLFKVIATFLQDVVTGS